MHFFGLNTMADQPRYNSFPMHQKSTESQWKALSTVLGKLVDRYVIVQRFQELQPHHPISVPKSVAHEIYNNPHAIRIRREHLYCAQISTIVASEHCYVKSADPNQPQSTKHRKLPQYLCTSMDVPHAATSVCENVPDGVLIMLAVFSMMVSYSWNFEMPFTMDLGPECAAGSSC